MESKPEEDPESFLPTSTNTPVIEPDSYSPSDDEDGKTGSSSNQSLSNSVWEFYKENGRTYHGYRAGIYHFPNDPSESERLEFQFALLHQILGERLHLAPIISPSRILDIGTGTGTWAIEMAETYTSAIVEATDLSPIQPTAVPENVHFIIDDAEQDDWVLPPDHYDYAHTRMMLGCFADFRAVLAKCFKHVKPGGWMESQELMAVPHCDDGTMPDDWPFLGWAQLMNDAALGANRPLRIADKLKGWYEEVGFVDVQEIVFKIPLNTWPKDRELKSQGMWWAQNILLGVQGFSLAYFSRLLGWSQDEIEAYLVNVRKALLDRRVHAYDKFYVVWGRKPETPSDSSEEKSPIKQPTTAQEKVE